jgi:hypothetical protein
MPRIPRGQQAGSVYHVINRGNGRATIFHKPQDYFGLRLFQTFQTFNRFASFITRISPVQAFQSFNRFAPFKTFREFCNVGKVQKTSVGEGANRPFLPGYLWHITHLCCASSKRSRRSNRLSARGNRQKLIGPDSSHHVVQRGVRSDRYESAAQEGRLAEG